MSKPPSSHWRKAAFRLLLTGLCLSALPAQTPIGLLLFVVPSDRPSGVTNVDGLATLSPQDREAAIPFVLPPSLIPGPEPYIPPYPPYRIDPALPAAEQAALRAVVEGMRVAPTGRRLYAFLRQRFGPLSGSTRVLTVTLASMGDSGDMAVTSGTPPSYQVTLNRQYLSGGGPIAMIPKLGHELVHVHDYVAGVPQSVAMEVSAHAADMALAYETNMAVTGDPSGAGASFNSLEDVYHQQYVPFRQAPNPTAYTRYWQALMSGVCELRPYRHLYVGSNGRTIWNSPPGPPGTATYVPYDPAFGLPDCGRP